MRHFPRTARRRMAAALAAGALVAGAFTAPNASADDLKDRHKQAEKSISSAKKDLHESSKALATAVTRLDAAKSALVDARTQLATARGKLEVAREQDAQMKAALEVAEAELVTAEAELAAGEAERAAKRDEVANMVADISAQGDPQLLALASLMGSETTADLTRQSEFRSVVVGRETMAYDQLRAAEVVLRVKETEVEAARDAVAGKRKEAAQHLVVMQGLESEKETARDSVLALVQEREAAKVQARKSRQRDLEKLRAAERQEKKLAAELKRRAERALARARARGQAGGGPTGGVLMYPVGGPITSPFGYRIHPIYGYWGLHDGTDFGGGCGQSIHAAAAGTVISSTWNDVYGNRLVVDHGAQAGVGLATIYNHASSYTVGPGTHVERGDLIGYVGDTGWSTACHLHFTVMANGKAVDPQNWF